MSNASADEAKRQKRKRESSSAAEEAAPKHKIARRDLLLMEPIWQRETEAIGDILRHTFSRLPIVPFESLEIRVPLGMGANSKVFLVERHSSAGGSPQAILKVFTTPITHSQPFIDELETLSNFYTEHSSHFIHFIGLSCIPTTIPASSRLGHGLRGRLALLQQYGPLGTLQQRLQTRVATEPTQVLSWIHQVATALERLHTGLHRCHGNLHPGNVVFTAANTAKLTDVAIGGIYHSRHPLWRDPRRRPPPVVSASTSAAAAFALSTPEAASHAVNNSTIDSNSTTIHNNPAILPPTFADDIYALALMLWALLTNSSDPPDDPAAAAAALPDSTPAGVRALVGRCLATDPNTRPNIGEVISALQSEMSLALASASVDTANETTAVPLDDVSDTDSNDEPPTEPARSVNALHNFAPQCTPFVRRIELETAIDDCLAKQRGGRSGRRGDTDSDVAWIVLRGLAGSGKSELAKWLAYRQLQSHTPPANPRAAGHVPIGWLLHADNESLAFKECKDFLRACGEADNVDAEEDKESLHGAVQRLVRRLQTQPSDWVVVLEGVASQKQLEAVYPLHRMQYDARNVGACDGTLPRRLVVVTTTPASANEDDWWDTEHVVAVGDMTSDEAAQLLSIAPLSDPTRCRQLLVALGTSPLALSLVRSAVCFTSLDELLAKLGALEGNMVGRRPVLSEIVRVLLTPILDALQHDHPDALKILHSLAWICPDFVPMWMVTELCKKTVGMRRAHAVIIQLCSVELVSSLGLCGVRNVSDDEEADVYTAFGMHRIVQQIVRNTTGPEVGIAACNAVAHNSVAVGHKDRHIAPQIESMLQYFHEMDSVNLPTLEHHLELACHYHWLGVRKFNNYLDTASGRALLLRGLGIELQQLGSQWHLTIAESMVELAGLYFKEQEWDSARDMYDKALAIKRRIQGEMNLNVAFIMHELGRTYYKMARLDEAQSLLEQALKVKLAVYRDENQSNVAVTMHELGNVFKEKGQLDMAIKMYEKALEIKRRVHRTNVNYSISITMHELAGVLTKQGKYDQAIRLYEQVLAIEQKLHGTIVHGSTAITIHEMGFTYWKQRNLQKAKQTLEQSLAIKQQVYGGTAHTSMGATYHVLGLVLVAMGQYTRAIEMFEQAWAIKRKSLGTDVHSNVALTMHELAVTYLEQDMLAPALDVLEKLLVIKRELNGELSLDVAFTIHELGRVNYKLGRLATAQECLERSLAITEEHYKGRPHRDLVSTLLVLGRVCCGKGELDRSMQLLSRSLEMCNAIGDDEAKAYIIEQQACVFFKLNDLDRTLAMLTEGLELKKKLFPNQKFEWVLGMSMLALVYLKKDDIPRAEELCAETLLIQRDSDKPIFHWEHVYATVVLADVQATQGQYERAISSLRRVVKERIANIRRHGEERNEYHPDLVEAMFELYCTLHRNRQLELATEVLSLCDPEVLAMVKVVPRAVALLSDALAGGGYGGFKVGTQYLKYTKPSKIAASVTVGAIGTYVAVILIAREVDKMYMNWRNKQDEGV